jgi:hypothetical protein
MNGSRNVTSEDTRRSNNNSQKKTAALADLHRLLKLIEQPGFDGTIAVELSAKDGFLARPKSTIVQYGKEP